MRKYSFILISIFFIPCLLISPLAYSSEKVAESLSEHDCSKCHQITKEEAQQILKDGIPDVKIIEIRPGPIKGLWEVIFEGKAKAQKGIVYIDFSKELVVSGSIFKIKTKTNLTSERLSSLNKVDVSKIPLNEAIVMGEKDATKKVIVFTDPD